MQSKFYIIVNQAGEAYIGMIEGSPEWSHDWNQGKPLLQENTSRILAHYPGTELVEV
jgi:hypothetical protein